MFHVLNSKGRNSFKENAIVPDIIASPVTSLLHSPDVVNQWISKDLSCDALMVNLIFNSNVADIISPLPVKQNLIEIKYLSMCFSDWSFTKDGLPGLWLVE